MTDTKHTPGPWEYQSTHNTERGMEIKIVMPNGSIKSLDEQEANARLIAAAPELLELCERMIEVIEYNDHKLNVSDLKADILAAIAKAKGGAA